MQLCNGAFNQAVERVHMTSWLRSVSSACMESIRTGVLLIKPL